MVEAPRPVADHGIIGDLHTVALVARDGTLDYLSWWLRMVGETQALWGDWIAHVAYFPAFLFGFGLARPT